MLFVYTGHMLILILINVQYLQNVAFSFKKVQMVKITTPQDYRLCKVDLHKLI